MKSASTRISRAFSNIGHSYAHIMMLLYPTVVLALEPVMHRSYGELLILMTAGNVLFGAGALPAGWLGDRWSPSGMMVVFFVGMGLSAVLTGTVASPLGLGIGLAGIGLFASIYHPVGMAWLVRNADNRGRALGFNGVFGSLGFASAALIAGVLTDTLGWRAAFIVPGLVSMATGAVLALLIRAGKVTDRHADIRPAAAPHRRAMVRAFFVLSLTMLCTGLIYQSLATVLPKLLAERVPQLTGGTPSGAGLLVALVYLGATVAQVVGGHLADRHSMRAVYMLVYLAQAPLLFLCAHLAGAGLFVSVAAAVIFNTVAIPVENTLLSHYSPDKWRGTAFGAKFVLALGVSALAVPLVAFLHDAGGGFYIYFVLVSALALVIVLASLWLPRDRRMVVASPAVTADP